MSGRRRFVRRKYNIKHKADHDRRSLEYFESGFGFFLAVCIFLILGVASIVLATT